MPRHTREFIALVRSDYETTDKTLVAIALARGISERSINRMRDREGWQRRSERPPLPLPAARLLDEATALLAVAPSEKASPILSPTLALPAAGEEPAVVAGKAEPSVLAGESGSRVSGHFAVAERIERLVDKELAAEENARHQLGTLPRTRTEAERCARTLATLTQTLHALARLRGEHREHLPDTESHDDDMPRDIDEFRRRLARRIREFVRSRTGGELRPDA